MRLLLRNHLYVFTTAACLLAASPTEANVRESADAASKLVSEAYELFESGKTAQALENFNQVLKEDATDLLARLGQAMVFSEQQRHKDAFNAYDVIVQNHPAHAFAWNGRGLAAFNLHDFDEALSSFERATADQPINGFFYEAMAWAHFCRGNHAEASASAKQATLMYNKNGKTASYPLLIAYFSQLEAGNHDEASRTLIYAENNKPAGGAWPTPVFEYLLGRVSATELISFVTDRAQETEAHTYIGLQLRSKGQADKAQPHLVWVARNGDARVFEHTLACTLQAAEKVAQLTP